MRVRVEEVKRKRGRPKKKVVEKIPNICAKCKYHYLCIPFRYHGVQTKYMEKVKVDRLYDGVKVLYIEECSKFELYDFREGYNKF